MNIDPSFKKKNNITGAINIITKTFVTLEIMFVTPETHPINNL